MPGPALWWLLACTPTCPEGEGALADGTCVPLAGASADDTSSGDSASGDSADTSPGETGDSGSGVETGDSETGDSGAECPWPDETDVDAYAEDECERFSRPCNHQVRVAIGGGSDWSVVEQPVALHASVPDALWVDRGEAGGEDWYELRIVYVDPYEGNVPEGASQSISVASLPIPARIVDDPDALTAALNGEGECGWRHRGTDAHELGSNIVDPVMESIVEADGQTWYYLLGVDNVISEEDVDPTGEPPSDPWFLRLGRSADGYDFEWAADLLEMPLMEDGSRAGGVDPDLYPLGWDAPYPADLSDGWAIGGGERWGLHLARGSELAAYEGDLGETFVGGSVVTDALSVATSSVIDGQLWVYGHRFVNPDNLEGPSNIYRIPRSSDGTYGEDEVVLRAEDHELAALGALSPSVIPLPGETGLELLVFHTPIDPPSDW